MLLTVWYQCFSSFSAAAAALEAAEEEEELPEISQRKFRLNYLSCNRCQQVIRFVG